MTSDLLLKSTNSEAMVRGGMMRSAVVASTVAGLGVVWWVMEVVVFRTVLITPLSQELVWTVRLLFGALGAWVGFMTARAGLHVSAGRFGRMRAALETAFVVLALGIVGGSLAGSLVWRVANPVLFWKSRAPITTAAFPITEVHRSGKGAPAVYSAPLGLGRALSVSDADIALLDSAGTEGTHPFCIPLRHQKEGDAERVWIPKLVRRNFPGTTIIACPDAGADRVRPRS
jgi:hypothetical protein